jgi:hypothetical protein
MSNTLKKHSRLKKTKKEEKIKKNQVALQQKKKELVTFVFTI